MELEDDSYWENFIQSPQEDSKVIEKKSVNTIVNYTPTNKLNKFLYI